MGLSANFAVVMTVNYYHICSDGNYSSVLFRNTTDFKAAMNRIAVCAYKIPGIRILAFVLMDNHVHFVVSCASESACRKFIGEFFRLTGKYNWDYYQLKATMRGIPVKIIRETDEDALRTVIAYVLKNPTKARLGMFFNYPWGTGNLFFHGGRKYEQNLVKLGDLSVEEAGPYAVRRQCRTLFRLPADWILREGVILPENYVDVQAVEKLFGTPRSYMFFLSLNKDDEIERDMGEWSELRMNDSELRVERDRIVQEIFGKNAVRTLTVPERLRLAVALRRKFVCSKKQLSRIVHLPYEELIKKL